MYYKLFSIFFFFLVKPFFLFFFIFGGQFKNKALRVDYSWASHTCYMSTYKPWFLAHTKMNILYSQMRFQLYQAHIMSVIGLKSDKKSINWVSVGILETLR